MKTSSGLKIHRCHITWLSNRSLGFQVVCIFQAWRKDNHLNIFPVCCHWGHLPVPGWDEYHSRLLSSLHCLHVLILPFQKWRKHWLVKIAIQPWVNYPINLHMYFLLKWTTTNKVLGIVLKTWKLLHLGIDISVEHSFYYLLWLK